MRAQKLSSQLLRRGDASRHWHPNPPRDTRALRALHVPSTQTPSPLPCAEVRACSRCPPGPPDHSASPGVPCCWGHPFLLTVTSRVTGASCQAAGLQTLPPRASLLVPHCYLSSGLGKSLEEQNKSTQGLSQAAATSEPASSDGEDTSRAKVRGPELRAHSSLELFPLPSCALWQKVP